MLSQAQAPVRVAAVDLKSPGPGEVLLRMEACGICHSDLFIAGLEKLSLAPLVLGHEGIGRIESVGPGVSGWAAGDRAGVTFLGTTCGTCEWCRAGRERFCPQQTNFGYTLQGALAQYVTAPAAALARVPADLPAASAAPLCCAGWTAFGALREAGLDSGQTVALFGLGGLGHLGLAMACHRGLRVAAVDPAEEKQQLARAAGAEVALPFENSGRVLQKEHGGVDAAIVFTAAANAIPQAFRALKRNGTLVLVGLSTSQYELPLVETVTRGITIRGSYLGTRQDLEDVFGLLQAGVLKPQVHMHSLDETPFLLDQMRRGALLGRAVIGF
ncbi:MAG TPA: alcohol dehydrogenase catalytic domain-containing protein [Bryobacteraceae bacterium]|nr:alcohol dehydrogenase catalytic domain-containing protein [Bryobacteraceae bacterium]